MNRALVLPAIVLAATLVATSGVYWYTSDFVDTVGEDVTLQVAEDLAAEFARAEQTLLDTSAFLATHPDPNITDFHRYMDARSPPNSENRPLAVTFVRIVPTSELESYRAQQENVTERAQYGYPPYELRPADNDVHYFVEWVHPANEDSIVGFDLGFNEDRIQAIEDAIQSGHATASRPVQLLPNLDPGTLLVQPIMQEPGGIRGVVIEVIGFEPTMNELVGDLDDAVRVQLVDPASGMWLGGRLNEEPQYFADFSTLGRTFTVQSEIRGFIVDLFRLLPPLTVLGLGTALSSSMYKQAKNRQIRESELEALVQTRTQTLERKILTVQALNADLDRFAYAASHDLQEPVRRISIHADLLANSPADEIKEEGRRKAQKIHESALQLRGLIQELLRFSQGQVGGENSKFDVCSMLPDRPHMDGDMPIHCDGGELVGRMSILTQIMKNLVENAERYAKQDENSQIWIHYHSPSHFSVEDNGPGVPPGEEEKIFNAFTQGSNAKVAGKGLGLSMIRRLIQRLEGEVWVERSAHGGAAFHVTWNPDHKDAL